MLPDKNNMYDDELEVSIMPSKTWRINAEKNRIEEIIDEKDAMSQAIDMILENTRYNEIILPDWYGNELWTLVGKELFYIESEASRMIKEALIVDDRIIDVKDFNILEGEVRDEVILQFTVITVFGEIETRRRLEGW